MTERSTGEPGGSPTSDENPTSARQDASAPATERPALAIDECPFCGGHDELLCLLNAAQNLNRAQDLDVVLREVCRGLQGVIDYDTFGVLLLDELGQELKIHFGHGLPPEVVEHWRFGLGQGIVGTVAKTQKPVLVQDVTADPRYLPAAEGLRSELAVPLIAKDRTIGVLDVASREPGHFTEQHQQWLSFLSGPLANAIENARLYENMRDQARTLSLLHEIGRELTSILDRKELLRHIAESIKRLIPYDLFSVMVWNEERETLEHAFSMRFDKKECMKNEFPLGYGICGTVAALRQPIRAPNVHLDPRYVDCHHGAEVRSELCVPLLFKDRLIGVLDLESVEYNAFSEEHEQLLMTLASFTAIALENAKLYDKIRDEEERLEQDLTTAREIQLQLLPKSRPWVSGLQTAVVYAPARHLAGDLYDLLPYDEGRTLVAVGDVAGKATAAALFGSLAIGLLRGHVVQHQCGPERLLEHLNEELRQLQVERRFVAMAAACYDARTRSLAVANAGVPSPRLVRGGRVEEIPVEGMPLGLMADVQYEQRVVELEPGDVVVFHTDGLHECMSPQGQQFGLERLDRLLRDVASLPVEEIAEALLKATDHHIGTGEPSDDRTIVVLKVTES